MKEDKRSRIHPSTLNRARTLRRPQTRAEAKLWKHLRVGQIGGPKFRRQHAIGPFIVDFYCAACKLVIEVDGDSHSEQVEYDEARTEWLVGNGYRVVRFSNRDVNGNLEGVLQRILEECRKGTLQKDVGG